MQSSLSWWSVLEGKWLKVILNQDINVGEHKMSKHCKGYIWMLKTKYCGLYNPIQYSRSATWLALHSTYNYNNCELTSATAFSWLTLNRYPSNFFLECSLQYLLNERPLCISGHVFSVPTNVLISMTMYFTFFYMLHIYNYFYI